MSPATIELMSSAALGLATGWLLAQVTPQRVYDKLANLFRHKPGRQKPPVRNPTHPKDEPKP